MSRIEDPASEAVKICERVKAPVQVSQRERILVYDVVGRGLR